MRGGQPAVGNESTADATDASGPTLRTDGHSFTRKQVNILDCTIREIAETGYGNLTIERVALRAEVARTTIYRRWETKTALVSDAMDLIISRMPTPNTGDLRTDLEEFLNGLIDRYAHTVAGRAIMALLADSAKYPELAEVRAEHLTSRRRSAVRTILQRGVERGELGPEADVETLVDLIIAPIPYYILIRREPFAPDAGRRIVAALLDSHLRERPTPAAARARRARPPSRSAR